jgi:putative oxidoreductase
MLGKLTEQRDGLTDAAYLMVRVIMGIVFVHAARGDFSAGLSTLVPQHREAGIPLPELSVPYTAYVQIIGGALLAVGLLARLWAAALLVVMAGAVVFVHWSEGFGEYNFPLTLAVALVALILTGPGRFSVDHVIARRGGAGAARRADGAGSVPVR